VDRLPAFRLGADGSYQSEVVEIPVTGVAIEPPPKEQYEASLQADWTIWDGGSASAREASTSATLVSDQASLRADLHDLRSQVADAYFAALTVQAQLDEVDLLVEDLDARLGEARDRVAEGAALPADTAAFRAEVLTAEQQRARLEAERRAALDVLERLTGRAIDDDALLVLPRVGERVQRIEEQLGAEDGLPDSLRVHPRFATFEAARAVQETRLALASAARAPRIAAFGRLAWGNPGYRQFSEDPHDYWRAGMQVQWQPFDWGRAGREAEEARVQQRIVDTREAAFADALLRAAATPRRRIAFLESALSTDGEIIALREVVEAQARARWDERAIPASQYTDARTDVLAARLALARHRIELVREQVRTLTILGMEIESP
jgi:outer membrane protein TolC